MYNKKTQNIEGGILERKKYNILGYNIPRNMFYVILEITDYVKLGP